MLLHFEMFKLVTCLDYFQMDHLFKRFLSFLVQEESYLKSHFHLFVNVLQRLLSDCTDSAPSDHPFISHLVHYVDVSLKYVLVNETARQFLSLSKNYIRRKIRDRLRAKDFRHRLDNNLHTYCDFCSRIVFFTEIVDSPYQYDSVYFTECCNHPVHKMCWEMYKSSQNCKFCDLCIDSHGKPDYESELTLHATFNRMKIKDQACVPRNVWFRNRKPVQLHY